METSSAVESWVKRVQTAIPSVWTDVWSELGQRIKGGLVGDEMTAPGNPGGILRLIVKKVTKVGQRIKGWWRNDSPRQSGGDSPTYLKWMDLRHLLKMDLRPKIFIPMIFKFSDFLKGSKDGQISGYEVGQSNKI